MSGIYIPGMEMPTTGLYFVSVDNTGGRDKTVVTVERMLGNRDVRQIVGSYEIIPVPDHGRLIDADALKEKQAEDADLFKNAYTLMEKSRRDEALNAIANIVNAPTIIPADPAKERES